jgi:DNA polymerase beta thumb
MHFEELGRRVKKTIPLSKAKKLADQVFKQIKDHVQAALVAGSIRRERPQIGDVEFVILPKDGDLEGLLLYLNKLGFEGGDRIQKKIVNGVPIELYIAHKVDELGSMLMWFTGDYVFNIAMNAIAKRNGWRRSQYGIQDAKTGEWLLQSPDERDFFDFLGVDYHTPEERSFKDRSKSKKSTMGAEMLIELGAIERNVGYIQLKLISPEEDGTDNWVLRVTRIDPFGGEPWEGEFPFPNEEDAKSWFKMVQGDEDIDHLISIFTHR